MIDKPGVYDFEGVTHVWKGEGCDSWMKPVAIMQIEADNVTVRNFGFRDAMYGIRIYDGGAVRENIRLENVEGYACFQGLALPKNISGIHLEGVSYGVWSGK